MTGLFVKYRFMAGVIIVGLLAGAAGFFYFRAEILTLERNQAQAAATLAEVRADAYRRKSILFAEAMDKARREDHDRHQFDTEGKIQIERGRAQGADGPAAPVLRDTGDRLRRRYDGRRDRN